MWGRIKPEVVGVVAGLNLIDYVTNGFVYRSSARFFFSFHRQFSRTFFCEIFTFFYRRVARNPKKPRGLHNFLLERREFHIGAPL